MISPDHPEAEGAVANRELQDSKRPTTMASIQKMPILQRARKTFNLNEKMNPDDPDHPDHHGVGRKLFVNLPLPDDLVDEEGRPSQQFARNKIRTAKYTPLSFIPKNLWFQFHNIANIFFLFVVILVVSIPIHTPRLHRFFFVPPPCCCQSRCQHVVY